MASCLVPGTCIVGPHCLFHVHTGVEPGYAALNDKGQPYLTGAAPGSIIARAKLCPQHYYCPGGSPFVGGGGVPQPCPNGLQTPAEGAASVEQCGEYVLGAAAAGHKDGHV